MNGLTENKYSNVCEMRHNNCILVPNETNGTKLKKFQIKFNREPCMVSIGLLCFFASKFLF